MSSVDDPPDLPVLPDRQELLTIAATRRDHFVQVRDEAQAEIDKADEYLASLNGGKKRRKSSQSKAHGSKRYTSDGREAVGEGSLKRCLDSLASHTYAQATTIRNETSLSQTYVGRVMKEIVVRGWATSEPGPRGRIRYRITDAGMEKATCPDESDGSDPDRLPDQPPLVAEFGTGGLSDPE